MIEGLDSSGGARNLFTCGKVHEIYPKEAKGHKATLLSSLVSVGLFTFSGKRFKSLLMHF